MGKSTLFNKLTASNRSLTSDIPNLTRDPILCEMFFQPFIKHNVKLEVMDTAGWDPQDLTQIQKNLKLMKLGK